MNSRWLALISFLDQFIVQQEYLIFFIYGLVYFLMGFAVLMQSRELSRLKAAKHLWLLGVFGVIHAIADWGPLFIPLESQFYGSDIISDLWFIYLFLLVFSFVFLFYFGIQLVTSIKTHLRWLNLLPLMLFFTWFLLFWYHQPQAANEIQWRYFGSTMARYLLALPGTVLAVVGLRFQLNDVRNLGFERVAGYLKGAIIFFASYSFFSAVIVPEQDFFPASWLNVANFYQFTGLPIELFRALTGLGIAYYIIRYLEVFQLETNMRLQKAERAETILLERDRINRDIHDGTMQSLYGLGMLLDHGRYLLAQGKYNDCKEHLDNCIEKSNEVIDEIRIFITDNYQQRFENRKLIQDVQALARDFELTTGLRPQLTYREKLSFSLSLCQRENLYLSIKELLWNVAKHAAASRVHVKITFEEAEICITVTDDGQGFDVLTLEQKHGHGLLNVRRRAEQLGGKMLLDSRPGGGTSATITVPLERRVNSIGLGNSDC